MPQYNERMHLIVKLQAMAKAAKLPRYSYKTLWSLSLAQLRKGKEYMERLAPGKE